MSVKTKLSSQMEDSLVVNDYSADPGSGDKQLLLRHDKGKRS